MIHVTRSSVFSLQFWFDTLPSSRPQRMKINFPQTSTSFFTQSRDIYVIFRSHIDFPSGIKNDGTWKMCLSSFSRWLLHFRWNRQVLKRSVFFFFFFILFSLWWRNRSWGVECLPRQRGVGLCGGETEDFILFFTSDWFKYIMTPAN